MEKRVIIAIVLSILVLMLWSRIYKVPYSSQQNRVTEKPLSSTTVNETEQLKKSTLQTTVKQKGKEIELDFKDLNITFTNKGALLKHWYLKEKKQTLDLILPDTIGFGIDEEFDNINGQLFSYKKKSNTINFKYKLHNGLILTKSYNINPYSNIHSFIVKIKNTSTTPKNIKGLSVYWKGNLGIDKSLLKYNRRETKFKAYIGEKIIKKLKTGEYSENIHWTSIINRYFVMAFINSDKAFSKIILRKNKKFSKLTITSSTFILNPNEQKQFKLNFILCEKNYKKLKGMGYNLEKNVDFGMFDDIAKIFFHVLNFLFSITKNYGLAIIMLTILIQIILFPLTRKSLQSMESMKRIQPELKLLQTKYKNDPKKLNIEIMNLYKSKKVNPFGGCLPMIIQMPIFIALFMMLRGAVELRHAPFILWIKDLSQPDTLFHTAGLGIHILPILMGLFMFIQQKMTSADPSHKTMMAMMPILFVFIFWSFPSGLVLYWLMSNILTILEHLFIFRKQQPSKVSVIEGQIR